MSVSTIPAEQVMPSEELLRHKAHLKIEGLRIDRRLNAMMAKTYRERVHFGLDYDYGSNPEDEIPDEIVLDNGKYISTVMFVLNEKSPYLLAEKDEKGRIALFKDGEPVCDALIPLRPPFYGEFTRDRSPMRNVCQWRSLTEMLFFMISADCFYWKSDLQCRYCNVNVTARTYKDMEGLRNLEHVKEVMETVREEREVKKLATSTGTLPGNKDIEMHLRTADMTREVFGDDLNFWSTNHPIPRDFKDFDRLQATGYHFNAGLDMEMWDKAWFEAICPGKTKVIGRDKWLAGLEYAVEVLGPRNVRSAFVVGIEPRDSVLEGIEYLAQKQIWGYPINWIPAPGSKLEGHRTPSPEWHVDMVKDIVRIWRKHGFTLEGYTYMTPGDSLLLCREAWFALDEEETAATGKVFDYSDKVLQMGWVHDRPA